MSVLVLVLAEWGAVQGWAACWGYPTVLVPCSLWLLCLSVPAFLSICWAGAFHSVLLLSFGLKCIRKNRKVVLVKSLSSNPAEKDALWCVYWCFTHMVLRGTKGHWLYPTFSASDQIEILILKGRLNSGHVAVVSGGWWHFHFMRWR